MICLSLVVPTFQLNECQYSWENLASFPEMDSYYEESSLSIIIYKENQNKDVLQFVKMLGRKNKGKKEDLG